MAKCEHCKNGKIKKGKRTVNCPYCMSENRLVAAIKKTITDSKKEGKNEFAEKLQIVLNHLPEYPVMAILEAEYLEMNPNLILMIRDSFEILPFGDQTYKGEKSGQTHLTRTQFSGIMEEQFGNSTLECGVVWGDAWGKFDSFIPDCIL